MRRPPPHLARAARRTRRRSGTPAPHAGTMLAAALALALTLAPATAFAAPTGGGGLAWEAPLAQIVASITGPVAMGVSLLGVVATGATLIWGGEINEFVRKLVLVVLVIALIVAAASILGTLYGVGAVIPAGAAAGTVVR